MPGVELICVWGMNSLVFEIMEILPGGVVVAAFDFPIATADGGMDGLVGLTVEVAGEAEGRFAIGASEAGGLAGILLKKGRLVHNSRFQW